MNKEASTSENSCAMALTSGVLEGLDDWLAVDGSDHENGILLEFTELSLEDKPGEKPIKRSAPLQSRHVEAYMNLDAGLSETIETLKFNHPTKDSSASFTFPLPPNAAIRR